MHVVHPSSEPNSNRFEPYRVRGRTSLGASVFSLLSRSPVTAHIHCFQRMAVQGASQILAPTPPTLCQRCRAQHSGPALRSSRRRRTAALAGKLPNTGYFSEADPDGALSLCMLAMRAETVVS